MNVNRNVPSEETDAIGKARLAGKIRGDYILMVTSKIWGWMVGDDVSADAEIIDFMA
jgi:hypothetical protein